MEASIVYVGYIGNIMALDNGKENGSYYLGLVIGSDNGESNGKENGK